VLILLRRLMAELGMSVIIVTHDLGVAAQIADKVAVMYAGRIVEQGSLRSVFYDAEHPYTWGLLGSIARLDRPRPPRLTAIKGMPPSLIHLPQGCAFGPRCPYRFDRCVEVPALEDRLFNGHLDACHLDPERKRDLRETAIHPELVGQAELASEPELTEESR
jgi:peptide/nickel transport system ATP-binding protein/oligopeptide transport system ATP-binding protein